MIKEIESLENYLDFANELSEDACFSDPHYTIDKNNLLNALEHKDNKVFSVSKDTETIGLFVWLIIPEDRYVEMTIGFSRYEEAYREMLNYIEAQYPNYQIDFVFNPQNSAIINVLHEKKATIDSEQQMMQWVREVPYISNYHVQLMSSEYEEEYLSLHNVDRYWTGERVLEASNILEFY